MRVSTWNLRGWTEEKRDAVLSLVETSDVLCLTEVWTGVPDLDNCRVYTELAPSTSNRARRGGGLGIIVPPALESRRMGSVSTLKYQVLAISVSGTPLVCCYLSPTATKADRDGFFFHVTRFAQGASIIAGDFNARHRSWDSTFNRQGQRLSAWAKKARFTIARPPSPTFVSARGSSSVDLIMARSLPITTPQLLSVPTGLSDHRPIVAEVELSSLRTIDFVPLAMLRNPALKVAAIAHYNQALPRLREELGSATSDTDLEAKSRQLCANLLHPWTRARRPRTGRFRPGWTLALDKAAKERTRLYKAGDKEKARALDKVIKRKFRKNVRRLQHDLGDQLENGRAAETAHLTKQLVRLHTVSAELTDHFSKEDYTSWMASTQPATYATISPATFTVSDVFREQILKAINALPLKKAPGPDKIRPEILQLSPDHVAAALLALWRAEGRLGYVPSVFRSGLLVPLYKKGDKSDPANYRPITLLSVLRKVVAKAILFEVEKVYSVHQNQWGFVRGSSTEVAIAFATNLMRSTHKHVAVLDIKQAYPSVPRDILLRILSARLPVNLVNMITHLLVPTVVRTQGQTSPLSAQIVLGVPQGDPLSPLLFDIFMDVYLERTNTISTQVASCFADDVILLGTSTQDLQELLDTSTNWSHANGMEWHVHKSFYVGKDHEACRLSGKELSHAEEVDYLGVSVSAHGVTSTRFAERASTALLSLVKLIGWLNRWNLGMDARINIVKTFVLSQIEYVLPLQPMLASTVAKVAKLEMVCLAWVLKAKITTPLMTRARTLARIPSTVTRRRIQALRVLGKFAAAASENPNNARAVRNWEVLRHFSALRPIAAAQLCSGQPQEIRDRSGEAAKEVLEEAFALGNKNRVRQIPLANLRKLPPALRSDLSRSAKHKAVLWYLNKLPVRTERVRAVLPQLRPLLESNQFGATYEEKCQALLDEIDLSRANA